MSTLAPTTLAAAGDLVFYQRPGVAADFADNELVLDGTVTAESLAEGRTIYHVMFVVDEQTVFGACDEARCVTERPMAYASTWRLVEAPFRHPWPAGS